MLRAFPRVPNKYFIETGSYYGQTIQMALDTGFFQEIYSIELAPLLYEHCKRRFAYRPNVKLFKGDSTDLLPQIIAKLDAPATFWLDGHYSSDNTARGITNSPILAELESIRQHPIKNHTIMIDDVRMFGTIEFDFIEVDEIKQKVLEINPNYKITFYDGGYIPGDVLIATV
ncbi:MAG: hypothetical protein JSS32_10845 [Verrucomicrobia bacterium]|nr:hypothetical protein [Verrucomicrobiota bacterium]